jgi:glycosyltransferase involved in cell wall biosynthesis
MRVALLSEYFPRTKERDMRGGVEARCYFLGRELAKTHDVTVYSCLEEGMDEVSDVEGMRVLRVFPKVLYSHAGSLSKRLRFMVNLKRKLAGERYDIVDGVAFMAYLPAWHSSGARKVITYHDLWLGRWIKNVGAAGLFGEAMERVVLSKRWDRIISVSSYTRDNLISHGVDADRISTVPNGIDLGHYSKIKARKYDEPTICCVARLVGYKRINDLLCSAAKLMGKFPNLRVKIVGEGPEKEKLKMLAVRLGISDSVEFLGFVKKHDDVLKIMKASDVVCLPSAVEGFGIAIAEAIALDVPYVASDIPAVREATSGGEGGRLYPVGDVDALSSALEDALLGLITGGWRNKSALDWRGKAGELCRVYGGLF